MKATKKHLQQIAQYYYWNHTAGYQWEREGAGAKVKRAYRLLDRIRARCSR